MCCSLITMFSNEYVIILKGVGQTLLVDAYSWPRCPLVLPSETGIPSRVTYHLAIIKQFQRRDPTLWKQGTLVVQISGPGSLLPVIWYTLVAPILPKLRWRGTVEKSWRTSLQKLLRMCHSQSPMYPSLVYPWKQVSFCSHPPPLFTCSFLNLCDETGLTLFPYSCPL